MALQIPPNCDLTLGLVCLEKSAASATTWRARLDERFLNPAGVIQGGFLSAILDSAMAASAVRVARGPVNVTSTEMKVSFIRSAHAGDELICTATVLKSGRVISFLEATIHNQEGELVATASSTYLIRSRTE